LALRCPHTTTRRYAFLPLPLEIADAHTMSYLAGPGLSTHRTVDINFDNLRSQLGTIVKLPRLPGNLPHGMTEADRDSFLLTKQRCQILEQALRCEQLRQRSCEDQGCIPEGIHGIGKSQLAYAIACIAYTNQWPLVYIVRALFIRYLVLTLVCCDVWLQPRCGDWVAPQPTEKLDIQWHARHFVGQFRLCTSELTQKSIKCEFKKDQSVYDMLNDSSPIDSKYGILIHSLRGHCKPVFIVLDDHHQVVHKVPPGRYEPLTGVQSRLRSWMKASLVTAVRFMFPCFPFTSSSTA